MINHKFSFKGPKAELINKLEKMRIEFLRLPISYVASVQKDGEWVGLTVKVGESCFSFDLNLHQESEEAWEARGFSQIHKKDDFGDCYYAVTAMYAICRHEGLLAEFRDDQRTAKQIWDLKIGQTFFTKDNDLFEVISVTEDGKGLSAKYLYGKLKGQTVYVFEEDIDFLIQ